MIETKETLWGPRTLLPIRDAASQSVSAQVGWEASRNTVHCRKSAILECFMAIFR